VCWRTRSLGKIQLEPTRYREVVLTSLPPHHFLANP
jgi:hypothetical protein